MASYNISFIGAGKLAGAMCTELYRKGFTINKIISSRGQSAALLAKSCGAESSSVPEIPEKTELLIIAIPDSKIPKVTETLNCNNNIVIVHTAGSSGRSAIDSRFKHTGVLYPLQTFTVGRRLNFREIPFFIESSDKETGKVIEEVAKALSDRVYNTNEETRRIVHLAAVFVSNFTNHLLTEGKEIAEKAGFGFDTLVPLLKETINKAVELGPENSQTGPALRNDFITIEKHMELLSFSPELKDMYKVLTESIQKRYNN